MGGTPSDRFLRHALHDLANLMTCILAAAAHGLHDPASARPDLEAIARAGELGARLLAAMRGRGVGDPGPSRVTDVMTAASVLLGCVAQPAGVVVTAEIEDVSAAIAAHELQEIVLNLGLNAIEAMPAGGRLRIAVTADERRVRLAVRDDGEGIEPGFLDAPSSSRGPGRGSGLGSVMRILGRAGGTISATTDADGTCFVVELPRG
jgi:signal transduction histidine kinase